MGEDATLPPVRPITIADEPPERQIPLTEGHQEALIPYGLSGDTLAALGEAEMVPAREAAYSRGKTAIREMAETLLLALLIFLTVRAVVQNFKVEGSSMEPTLHHGQYLLVNKAAYLGVDFSPLTGVLPVLAQSEGMVAHPFGTPNRGDIIVFRFPRNPERDFIKRVVALPGETVEIRAGVVYINSQRFEEAYVLENPTYSREPAIVPPDNYFVLGDNRNNSSDSHVWGPVPMENIVGRAWLTYWPWKDSGVIPSPQAAAQR